MARERENDRGRKFDKPAQVLQDEFEYKILHTGKVTKVIKGGSRSTFVCLVLVGNKKGKIGYGIGRSAEYMNAIEKAKRASRKKMILIPIIKGTIPHEVNGIYNGCKLVLVPACAGTGIKTGGSARAICELAGIQNIMGKYFSKNSCYNNLLSALDAFKKLRDPISIARDRGVSLQKVFNG